MTSNKRYRHHQDSGSGGALFRELPPSLKRQKSSSSPSRSTPGSQIHQGTSGAKIHQGTSGAQIHQGTASTEFTPTEGGTKLAPASQLMGGYNLYPLDHSVRGQVKPQVYVLPNPQAARHYVPTFSWSHLNEGGYVVPAFDGSYYSSVGSPHSLLISNGTNICYKSTSPPLSSWTSRNVNVYPRQHGAVVNPTWQMPLSSHFANKHIDGMPKYFDSTKTSASNHILVSQHSPVAVCNVPASSPKLNTSFLPSVQKPTSPFPGKTTKASPSSMSENSAREVVDLSDPDIRTIEMLRELERVADQKENDNNNTGSDRKSLVSHHLRMLMCAVDRYTEGIDDELTLTSQCSDITSPFSRGSTPGTSSDSHEGQTCEISVNKQLPDSSMSYCSYKNITSQMESRIPTTSPVQKSEQSYLPSNPSSPPNQGEQISESKLESAASWDLWSSPTFDFCDVLKNKVLQECTFNFFDDSAEKDEGGGMGQRNLRYF